MLTLGKGAVGTTPGVLLGRGFLLGFGGFLRGRLLIDKVIGVVAWKVLYLSPALKDKEVIHNLIHEIAVVRDNHQAALIVQKELLQDVERNDVKVIGWLVQNEEVRVLN